MILAECGVSSLSCIIFDTNASCTKLDIQVFLYKDCLAKYSHLCFAAGSTRKAVITSLLNLCNFNARWFLHSYFDLVKNLILKLRY